MTWNRGADELWGLRSAEVVGQHLLNLDIGLPVDELRPALRRALAASSNGGPDEGDGRQEIRLDAVNRRGRSITLRVTCVPLVTAAGTTTGAILAMEPIATTGS